MQALDTDKNGELSPTEIANAPAALRALDKNGDGKLGAEELRPALPEDERSVSGPAGNAEALGRLMAYDQNGDGKLSADELPQRMRSMVTRADADKDGFATKEELTKALAAPGAELNRVRPVGERPAASLPGQPPAKPEQK